MDFVQDHYLIIKALHIISMIAWMAGLFYLPRLFVYHADVPPSSNRAEMLKVMERKLLKIIMNPAMILSFVFGGLMLGIPEMMAQGWIHAKLTLVLLLAGFHGLCARYVRLFANNQNTKSHRYYRVFNEVPTLLMVAIVMLAVLKPF
ncbi:MAG: protoporphyrinogen oxidase HemJ [Alphaproteobacteria bacterium]